MLADGKFQTFTLQLMDAMMLLVPSTVLVMWMSSVQVSANLRCRLLATDETGTVVDKTTMAPNSSNI